MTRIESHQRWEVTSYLYCTDADTGGESQHGTVQSDYEFCLVLCLRLVGTSKGLGFDSTEGIAVSNEPDEVGKWAYWEAWVSCSSLIFYWFQHCVMHCEIFSSK